MSGIDEVRERKRRAHWLRLARVAADVKQPEAARYIGYKAGTSITAMEKARKDPTAIEMQKLAELYGVPVSMFADPEPTDQERVESARAELARVAIALAGEDMEGGPAPDQRDAARPAPRRHRRSA